MKSLKRFKVAMIFSVFGLFLALMLIASANSAKADKSVYGKVIDVQDNLIIIEIDTMDEPPLFQGQQIELWIPDTGNNPDPVVTPTAIPLCGADCE